VNLDAQTILKRRRFEELMQAGRKAYKQGKRRLAHDHWHEAATVDPYNEQVWLSLFRVLETDEDRIACLENIIAINPMNVQARRRLRGYQHPIAEATASTPAQTAKHGAKARPARPKPGTKEKAAGKPRRRLGRVLAIVVVGILIGLLTAVVASIFIFGR